MYRIAFFGSDLFSLSSLQAVHKLQARRPDLIHSLAVTTRRLKPSGRGMKQIYEPPIVRYAKEQNLPWFEIENQAEFSKLADFSNLAIAVSYGKLIPASYLEGLTHGGLNVHPSLLPQYKGAAPLQRAIMDRQSHTGVSVQSLHPTKFDHGAVLWQSAPVALSSRETTTSLSEKLANMGAEGLISVLSRGGAMRERSPVNSSHHRPTRAPIIDRQEYKIDFNQSYAETDARGRALEKLWFDQRVEQKVTKSGKVKGHPVLRVNLSGFVPVVSTDVPPDEAAIGALVRGRTIDQAPILALKVKDGFVGASEVTVAGCKKESPGDYFFQLDNRGLKEVLTS